MNNGQIIDFFITGIILLMILNIFPQNFWLDDEKIHIIKATEIKQKILKYNLKVVMSQVKELPFEFIHFFFVIFIGNSYKDTYNTR